jgi:ABC-type polysaccharide/polyol phosphate transport system ATPase subunit
VNTMQAPAQHTAFLKLDHVTVDFPIYEANARSLKARLAVIGSGGRIGITQTGGVSIEALSDITISLHPGDRLALLGHNGAGKSTLLRVMAGIYEPVRGSVHHRGRVGSLFDLALGMDPDATGWENVMIRGLLAGMTRREVLARREEIGAFTDLGDYLAMPVRTYSTGMLLRLAFAVCTSSAPDILLMDEWLSVGDTAFVERAETRMQEIVDNAGIVVLASHNSKLMARVCTKAMLLEHGRVVSLGPVDEVLDLYARTRHHDGAATATAG